MPSNCNRTIEDESFLKAMGATMEPVKDPHQDCLVRWLEERDKRQAAEMACHRAWRTIEEQSENIGDLRQSAEWWRESFWWAAGMAGVFAVVMVVIAIVK